MINGFRNNWLNMLALTLQSELLCKWSLALLPFSIFWAVSHKFDYQTFWQNYNNLKSSLNLQKHRVKLLVDIID